MFKLYKALSISKGSPMMAIISDVLLFVIHIKALRDSSIMSCWEKRSPQVYPVMDNSGKQMIDEWLLDASSIKRRISFALKEQSATLKDGMAEATLMKP